VRRFQTIGLFCPAGHAQHHSTLTQLTAFLKDHGFTPLRYLAPSPSHAKKNPEVDAVISIGGDGTLLRIARGLSKQQIPLIGMNRGTLGFLTDIAPEHFEASLLPLLKGSYQESHRFLLEGTLTNAQGQRVVQNNALNDIVLFSMQSSLVEFDVWIDDRFVYRQRSDGLIISTPTGSTAYSLAAGGPIVMPETQAILLVPKAPHALTFRPLVIPSHQTIRIEIAHYRDRAPHVSFDGHEDLPIQTGDSLVITQQETPLVLLHPPGHDNFQALRSKLQWAMMPAKRSSGGDDAD